MVSSFHQTYRESAPERVDSDNCQLKIAMDKTQKVELERIQKELVDAHNKAAWQMAATIIKASLVKNGMDQPPTAAELAELNATITNLRSVAEDALELLKR